MDLELLQNTPPWEWPRDAANIFLEFLTDSRASESDRLIAAELAGDSVAINDELANALLAIVRNANESDELRAKAVISFGPVLETVSISEFDDPYDIPPITEGTFHEIQDSLQKLYADTATPKLVRRRILEASVRSPEPWHEEAIREAYSSGDQEWVLTAVFAMRYIRGFDEQIVAALENPDEETHYEAIEAAGAWSLAAAWPHVIGLLADDNTPKPLLLAAIEAVGSIRPGEARDILEDFADSDDEEIAETADEAIMMADVASDDEFEEEDEEGEDWVN